ncbi:MAG: hypothetical protein HY898_05550 [Deltaproteobacteria bacterium]|nr:hypothetical protein [Deltaproteobacteria bacterium]
MRSVHPERLWQLDLVNDLRRRVEQLEGGRASAVASNELRARHFMAVRSQSAVFRVIGMDRDIPIGSAWELSAQWTGIENGRDKTFHAHRLLESPHRMAMLVAEGGGGKSTVLRRIASDATARGALVVRVRAKTLAALADDEPTFAVALRRVIADQSGVTSVEAAQLETEMDVLLLDGLDEVGERAEPLASECVAYAATRESLRLVIAARPSHAAAAGEPFVRATLLPLLDHERWSAVVELLLAVGESAETAKQIASRLSGILEKTSFESLPLHITMALHLARSDDRDRISLATLYDRVLTSLRSRPISDRTVPDVDRVFAARALDAAAWHLTSQQGSLVSDIVRSVADAVAGGHGIEQETRADEALRFWEARAVLRRERVGGNDRLDFAHDSLRDYVAAQHLTQLPPGERRTWIAERRPGAMVRFAVASAGEAVLGDVFAADPPTNIDALIRCASVAREMAPLPSRFAEELASNAVLLLASDIPRTVARITDAILPLVPAAPMAFGAAADAAMRAGNTWNVLAAWLVRVHTGVELGDPDALSQLLARGGQDRQWTGDDHSRDLWNRLLEPALDALIRSKGPDTLHELVETLVLGDARLSVGAHDRILARLADWGYADLLTRYRERISKEMNWHDDLQRGALAADRAFLGLVAETFGPADARDPNVELPNLSALLHAFDFWHAAITDWNEAFFTRGAASMSVLLRGAAHAAACDEAVLATEARHALALYCADCDRPSSAGVRKLGSGSPRDPDWKATSTIGSSIPHLLTALPWPDAYARVALLLLVNHPDQRSARRGITLALDKGVRYVVDNAEHLSDVVGCGFADVLAGTVATPTDATAPLLVTLAKLEPSSLRTAERVANALESSSGVLVDAAAEAALELPTSDRLLSALRVGLERWRKWAAGDGPLKKRESGIIEPGTTLHAQRVAENLVGALAAHSAFVYEDLVALVREGSGKALVALMAVISRDLALLDLALDDVESGALPARVAEQLLRAVGVPSTPASRLLSFHAHANASVRRAVVVGLRDCPWVAREDARQVWTARLTDPDVHVRNEAQRALDERPLVRPVPKPAP